MKVRSGFRTTFGGSKRKLQIGEIKLYKFIRGFIYRRKILIFLVWIP